MPDRPEKEGVTYCRTHVEREKKNALVDIREDHVLSQNSSERAPEADAHPQRSWLVDVDLGIASELGTRKQWRAPSHLGVLGATARTKGRRKCNRLDTV